MLCCGNNIQYYSVIGGIYAPLLLVREQGRSPMQPPPSSGLINIVSTYLLTLLNELIYDPNTVKPGHSVIVGGILRVVTIFKRIEEDCPYISSPCEVNQKTRPNPPHFHFRVFSHSALC